MPRIVGRGASRLLLTLLVAALVICFSPLSRILLRSVNGSFAPSPYSSLALKIPSDAEVGILAGQAIPIKLTNRTGHVATYQWSATEKGTLVSLGAQTVANGHATTIQVPSRGAATGTLKISLTGTNIFVTVPVLKS